MLEEIAKILSVVGLSAFRHTFGGVPLASGYGFSYFEVALLTAVGGTIGLLLFIYVAKFLSFCFAKLLGLKRSRKPKTFTFRNRLLVKIKQRWGLYGIAFLTPPLLSIPIGTTIAASMYKDKRKVFVVLFTAVLFWSFAGAFMSYIPFENLFANLRP